jgi:hypothetical protein
MVPQVDLSQPWQLPLPGHPFVSQAMAITSYYLLAKGRCWENKKPAHSLVGRNARTGRSRLSSTPEPRVRTHTRAATCPACSSRQTLIQLIRVCSPTPLLWPHARMVTGERHHRTLPRDRQRPELLIYICPHGHCQGNVAETTTPQPRELWLAV